MVKESRKRANVFRNERMWKKKARTFDGQEQRATRNGTALARRVHISVIGKAPDTEPHFAPLHVTQRPTFTPQQLEATEAASKSEV